MNAMNTQAVEHFKTIFTNPYTWMMFAFILTLPYLLKYMRRFFPKKLQKKIEKEEACDLEYRQQPEIVRLRKKLIIGIIISLIVSAFISYLIEESWRIFTYIFASMITIVVLYAVIVEYILSKNKYINCLKIYNKREILILIGIYGGLIFLFTTILVFGIGITK